MEEVNPGGDLTYSERPVKIFDTAERVTRSKVIKMCKDYSKLKMFVGYKRRT
jgi:hypothetical protein